ncbi:MAG: tetratricopeptide repeat protein [Acidobacteriota bacterium]
MKTIHPDEATLLRSIIGELPERRRADLGRHLARCGPCSKDRAATRRLHERLSAAGDSLAFAAGSVFAARPVSWSTGQSGRRASAHTMQTALARIEGEKEPLLAAVDSDASKAARELDLTDAACRLAAAHVLEEAVMSDPSERIAEFAARIASRNTTDVEEAEAVVPLAQLRALSHLVSGNWSLFTGRPRNAVTDLRSAWAELGAFDAPEHLLAWVEIAESLRRSYEGRAVEGRVLAERALETFERYGLQRGIVRARHALAVAQYTASEFREAHRGFRAVIVSNDATKIDRARAVSGAAFCLAARGRFHDAAKEYSRVRRRLRGEGAQLEQYLLQGEMKAALGTAGRWQQRMDGLVGFALPEAAGAFHGRQLATEIVKAVSEEGIERAKELLGKIEADPSRGYAYLYACQLALPKLATNPTRFLDFSLLMAEATRSLPYLRDKGPAQPVCREQVLGEAALLASNTLNFLGKPGEARVAAKNARRNFIEAGEDTFALALADYFEGSAASFEFDERGAWSLLRRAHSEFQVYGQENWTGRAEAALGTLLVNRGRNAAAIRFLDGALTNLHPEQDGSAYAQALVNRGYALVQLGRLDAAKATYAKALSMARRLGMSVSLLMIRTGLASIDLASGKLARALMLFEKIGAEARSLDLPMDVLCADLRVAECLGRMGREQEMLDQVERVSASPGAESLKHDQALRELFESVKGRNVSHELLAHVARFVEARDRGARAEYRPFKLVANGN